MSWTRYLELGFAKIDKRLKGTWENKNGFIQWIPQTAFHFQVLLQLEWRAWSQHGVRVFQVV